VQVYPRGRRRTRRSEGAGAFLHHPRCGTLIAVANRPSRPELTLRTRAAWRRWLKKGHAKSRGVWFVHFR